MSHAVTSPNKLERSGISRLVVVVVLLLIDAVILFAAAGTLQWPAAWFYEGMRLAALLIFGVIVIRVNPEIINERGRMPKNTKPFDKLFGVLYTPLVLLLPLAAGLDFRFGWSDMGLGWRVLGLAGLLPAMILPYAAMIVNAYLTTTVRIQEERGHKVISSGPYRVVRHPMYVGLILLALCAPLLLGSWAAFVIGNLTTILAVWRTKREDETLQAELPGYAAYAAQVRYRLFPGIW